MVLATAAAYRTASATPVRLQSSGDACRLDALEAQLASLLGTDPIDPHARAGVRVEVDKPASAIEGRVWFDDGVAIRGPRIVTASTCSELVDSIALVIAMALPDLATPVAITQPPAAPPMIDVPPPDPGAAVEARTPEPKWFDVVVAGAAGIGSGRVEGELIVGVGARRRAMSLNVELRADLPQDDAVAAGERVAVLRAQVTVSPCLHVAAFSGCALASVGALRGAGVGLMSERHAYAPLVAGGLRAAWEHPILGGIALRLHVDVDALATTTQFDVDYMQAWVSPRFEASAGIGIVAHFP
jgi:hypothetical protein